MLKVAFGTAGVLAIAMLAGCAGTQNGSALEMPAPIMQYTFQDPNEVPQEKWSKAMVIARAMGIDGGLMDVIAPEGAVVTPQGKVVLANQGVDPLVGGALGAVSPTTHISGGASVALGAAFFILGGQATAPYMFDNMAFWVPEEMAANAEEARAVAENTWREARVNAFSTKRYNVPRTTMYPIGHKHHYGKTPVEMLANVRYGALPFSGAPRQVEVGAMSGSYYGPIFIMDVHLQSFHDKRDSGLEHMEYYELLAQFIPSWSAMYFPPERNRRREVVAPAVVIHNGEVLQFIVQAE